MIDNYSVKCAEGKLSLVCVCALSSVVDCTAMRCVQSADPGLGRCHSQSAVSFHCGTNFQQFQKKQKCDGLEGRVTFRGVYLRKEAITDNETVNAKVENSLLDVGAKHPFNAHGTLLPLSLIFHCATSFHREPKGVLFRARRHTQRDAGGRRTQAWFHCHLPLRQWLHARGRPDPDLHHGWRRQAKLEQAQTHLHW